MAWLSGWNYRKPITITEKSGSNLSDYQVKIVLDSSNFDFTKAKSNGADIRFTDTDGSTLLSYWIEKYDFSNEKAVIWVKVPFVPASSTKTIYMYYGNSLAIGASSGEDTFDFFDDFLGNSLDSGKWVESEYKTLNATVTVSNSIFKIEGVNDSYSGGHAKGYFTKASFSINRRIRVKVIEEDNCNGESVVLGFLKYPLSHWFVNTTEYGVAYLGGSGSGSSGPRSCNFYVYDTYGGSSVTTENFTPPIIMDIKWTASSARLEYSDGNSYSITSNIPTNDLPVGIFTGSGWAKGCIPYIAVDWVAVAKYVEPEPTYSIGGEESTFVYITGTVRDSNGIPVSNVKVIAIDESNYTIANSATSQSDGSYSISVPQGKKYTIIAIPPNDSDNGDIKCHVQA